MFKKVTAVMASAAALSLGLVASAFAAVDYAPLATAATTEITAGITAAMPVLALVLGATVGVRLFKRFAK